MGDVLDGYSIVVTVAGVCTSLGLGAIQVIAGLQFLGWIDEDISESKSTSLYNVTIWFITAIATASVISGVHAGVKFLSQLAFMLGMLLTLFIFIMDDSKFLMNLFVQEVGYFLQHSLLEMNFWTDAFAQLRPGSGRAIDGNAGFYHWMDDWVIFYQAWWYVGLCFCCFLFILSSLHLISRVMLSEFSFKGLRGDALSVSLWPVSRVVARLPKSSLTPWLPPFCTAWSGVSLVQ